MGPLMVSLLEDAVVALIGIAAANLWQLRAIRATQIEHGLKLEFLTGLMDGRTTKIAQDVEHACDLLLEDAGE